jgi:hypothetical protein
VWETRNTILNFGPKCKEKKQLVESRHRWKDNIKMNIKLLYGFTLARV